MNNIYSNLEQIITTQLQNLLLIQVLPNKVKTNCGTCKTEISKPLANYIRSETKDILLQ